MEENLFEDVPQYKLYNEMAIRIGTFLGGPLIAGYLIAENFKMLGKYEKLRLTWLWTGLATIIIFMAAILLSDVERFPKIIVPVAYAWVASWITSHFQGASLKTHISNNGQLYTTGRAAWIGLIGGILMFGIIFIILIAANKEFSLF
jgi:hypothetical protein